MSKYIHYFTAVTAYTDMRENNYEEPWVSLTEENTTFEVNYNKISPKYIPLTFEITSNGSILWRTSDTANTKTIQYKLNDGEWTSITSTTEGVQIPVESGDTVQFMGNNDSYTYIDGGPQGNSFTTTSNFKVKGNIMSLINPTNYANLTSFPENSNSNLVGLFQGCSGLTDASELILPATTLTEGCYADMFQGCTGLVNAPELPATTLTTYCYDGMFRNCTSLVNAPELPATTLDDYCYEAMFQYCTSLTTAPSILPATTLTEGCYQYMFEGCTSLTTAPELPATTLAIFCYYGMFYDCENLNYIKCLATDITEIDKTVEWVDGVQTTSGTFIIQNGTEDIWKFDTSGIPRGWTVYNMSGDDVTDQIQVEEEIIE